MRTRLVCMPTTQEQTMTHSPVPMIAVATVKPLQVAENTLSRNLPVPLSEAALKQVVGGMAPKAPMTPNNSW